MARITVSVEIGATPERVWQVVEPIERHVDWMADAEEIRFTSGKTRGVGTTFDCVTKVGPITLVDVMTITEWDPGKVMGVRHSGVVTGEGRFTLEPVADGARTTFTWSETLRFPWWLGWRLGELIGGGVVMRLIWRRNLRALKSLVESP